MSTFETLARELATRFDLGNQATPFLRMLMAHMTNPDNGRFARLRAKLVQRRLEHA